QVGRKRSLSRSTTGISSCARETGPACRLLVPRDDTSTGCAAGFRVRITLHGPTLICGSSKSVHNRLDGRNQSKPRAPRCDSAFCNIFFPNSNQGTRCALPVATCSGEPSSDRQRQNASERKIPKTNGSRLPQNIPFTSLQADRCGACDDVVQR